MLKLNHIGIAVKSIEKTLPFYQDGLGLTIHPAHNVMCGAGIEEVPAMKVKTAKLSLVHPVRSEDDKKDNPLGNFNTSTSDASNGASTVLELVEPLPGEEAVTKFLEKRGEGVHHICFGVEDIKAMMKQLESKGYKPLYPEPKIGAGGHLVNFLSPKDTSGVLIEISQEKQ